VSGLPSLIRLHKWKLEEHRRKLGDLESLARSLADQIRALDERTQRESQLARGAPDVAHALGGFVQAALTQREKLQSSLAEVEREIAAMHERVGEAFRELKRYELTDARRRDRARLAARRRERIAEDEIGVEIYRRKDGSGGR
jgi:flagellar export protein FliJ